MKPWFAKEADIIKFPEPDKKVVQMPNVASYPDFLTGVQDLQARKNKGEISSDSHAKLFSDLIKKFAKNEDVEMPWFFRENPDQQKIDNAAQQALTNPNNLRFLNKILNLDAKTRATIMKQIDNINKGITTPGQQRAQVKQIQMGIDKRIMKYIQKRGDKDAIDNAKALVQIIKKVEPDTDKLKKWLKSFVNPKYDYVDIDKLLPRNGLLKKTSYKNLITDPLAQQIFDQLLRFKGLGKSDSGPGEAGVAILSPYITFDDEGDLLVTDTKKTRKIEVKADAGNIYPMTGDFKNWPKFADLRKDYEAGKVLTFARAVRKDKKTGKVVTKVKGSVLTLSQFAKFLDGSEQQTGVVLATKGKESYMRSNFVQKISTAWFGEDVGLDASSGQKFKKSFAAACFDFYKKIKGHEGVLWVDGTGEYKYYVSGSQLEPEDLQMRSLFWTNDRGQSRGDVPSFKEL
jgi:hypothetical protein